MIRTTGGCAVSTANTDNYDDAYAYLSTSVFNSMNYQVEGTVFKSGSAPARELEIMLRMSDSSTGARGYECLMDIDTLYPQIVRWNGGLGDFTEITSMNNLPPSCNDGDKLRATIVGNTINFYLLPGGSNPVLIASATDSTFPTGQPGMALFVRTANGNPSSFGLKDLTVVAI
jgi:hypothetical protein